MNNEQNNLNGLSFNPIPNGVPPVNSDNSNVGITQTNNNPMDMFSNNTNTINTPSNNIDLGINNNINSVPNIPTTPINSEPVSSVNNVVMNNQTESINNIPVNQENNSNTSINNQATNINPTVNNQIDNKPIQNDNSDDNNSVASVKDFLVYNLLCCIPLVGFIIMLVKAFGSKANKNISNLAKAQLILSIIGSVVSILLIVGFFGLYIGMNKKVVDKAEEHINNNYNDVYDYDNYYSFD